MNLRPLVMVWSRFFDGIGHYDRRLRRASSRGAWFIPVYHRIVRDGADDPLEFGLGVQARHFQAHLGYFRSRFHVCTIKEALAVIAGGERPDRPLLSITFDDGYLDNVDLAAPLLEQHGLKATFFICTGPIAEDRPFWWDLVEAIARQRDGAHWQDLLQRLRIAGSSDPRADFRKVLASLWARSIAEIESLLEHGDADLRLLKALCPPRMTAAHTRQLAEQGMEIAAHTHNHPNLTREGDEAVRDEISRSKALLEAWTGQQVTGFATPNGYVDERVKAACRAAGITYLASTEPGMNASLDAFGLARFGAANTPLANFKRGLTSMIDREASAA